VAQPAGELSPGAMRVLRTRKDNLMPRFDAKASDPLWLSVRQAPPDAGPLVRRGTPAAGSRR